MREREIIRQIGVEMLYGFRQVIPDLFFQVVMLCILPYQEYELRVMHLSEQLLVPLRGTFRPGWEVSGFSFAGKAEPHGYERKFCDVVKSVFAYSEPVAQIIPAFIVPGYACLVYDAPGRLTYDHYFTFLSCGHNGVCAHGQLRCTYRTLFYLLQQWLHDHKNSMTPAVLLQQGHEREQFIRFKY